jgi:cytochrome c oxidase cbb3-type subunit I
MLTQIKAPRACRRHYGEQSKSLGREVESTQDRTKGRKMWDYVKLVVLGLVAVFAAIAANYARDLAYLVNALVVMLACRRVDLSVGACAGWASQSGAPANEYMDGVVRAGVIATAFWGVVGFLVGWSSPFSWPFRR